jgi:hypothetical protein
MGSLLTDSLPGACSGVLIKSPSLPMCEISGVKKTVMGDKELLKWKTLEESGAREESVTESLIPIAQALGAA